MAGRRSTPAYASGSGTRRGDACLAQRRRPRRRRHWHDSDQAEQHLLHLGQADEPVCWTLVGFASGYMSCVYGKEVIAIEDRCRGKGDAVCRAVVRAKEEWGPELAMHLPFYQKACLDSALTQLTDILKKQEQQLRSRRALQQRRPDDACPVSSAPVQRWFGRSISRGASRRSTRPC